MTASETRICCQTIHGCRPTSVTIQPDSSATIAPMPLIETARRNHFVPGRSLRRHQEIPNQAPRASSPVPIPTMASKARCRSVFEGGRSSFGMSSSPVTTVSVLNPTSSESSPGMPIPNLTPSSVQIPPIHSVWSGPVSSMHSKPANLAGWWSATPRAATSPTYIWIGAAIAPTVSGMISPSRCRRLLRLAGSRSIAIAYSEASPKPTTM